MSDIVEFITARLAEHEALATKTIDIETRYGMPDKFDVEWQWVCFQRFKESGTEASSMFYSGAPTPAEVLDWMALMREMVERFTPRSVTGTDAELHARCAHPEWEYATTEGQRKRWDDVDVPPEGDGWVRNVEEGRDGWERFDYTEESYWRRLLPDGPRVQQQQQQPPMLRRIAAIWSAHPEYREEWAPAGT